MLFFEFKGIHWILEATVYYTLYGQPRHRTFCFVVGDEASIGPVSQATAKQILHKSAVILRVNTMVPICPATDLRHIARYRVEKRLTRDDIAYIRTLTYRKRMKLAGVA